MSLRFHEIAESGHRILNPFTDEKLALVGDICDLVPASRVLDLCCGKGELLCTWSARHGASGTGVDISDVFLAAARARAAGLGVADRVTFVHGEARAHVETERSSFDVVSCVGATWIGGGLVGTIELMAPRLEPGGLLVIGEPYWVEPLPEGVAVPGIEPGDFASLAGTLDRIASAGFDLVEMVLADGDSWDRYVAAQWRAVDRWVREHAGHPEADALDRWARAAQRSYLAVDRRYLGWGVFVLRRTRGEGGLSL